MNDTVLGALIAGGIGVLTAVVGGLIRWFLDVQADKREKEKVKEERDHQRDVAYLEKRTQAYERFVEYYASLIRILCFAMGSNFEQNGMLKEYNLFDYLSKDEASCITAIKMYGHPKIYEAVNLFVGEFVNCLKMPKEECRQELTKIGGQLEGIAHNMREEITRVLCHMEEICV